MTYAPKFGSFTFDSTNGITVTDWGGAMLNDVSWRSRVAGRGRLFTRQQIAGRRIDITGVIRGSSASDTRDKVGDFLFAVQNGEDYLWINSDRRIPARLEGSPTTRFRPGSQLSVVEFSVSFGSRRATWESSSETSDSYSVTSSPDETTLTSNDGDAPAYPTITLTNNTGSAMSNVDIALNNTTSSKGLKIQGIDIQAGQPITVDMEEGRLGDGTIAAPRPSVVSGAWWDLVAGSASVLQIVTNASLGGSGLGVNVLWHEQFQEG